jgi:hypothetical protein
MTKWRSIMFIIGENGFRRAPHLQRIWNNHIEDGKGRKPKNKTFVVVQINPSFTNLQSCIIWAC